MENKLILTRRFRKSNKLRNLISETKVNISDLIWPIFIEENLLTNKLVDNMPGIYTYTIENCLREIEEAISLGITSIVLRPIPAKQNYDDNSKKIKFVCDVTNLINKAFPEVVIILDNYFYSISRDGFFGVKSRNGSLNIDETLKLLGEQAIASASAGADVIVTLGRVENEVYSVRQALNNNDFADVPILSYASNFASTLAHAMHTDPIVKEIHKEGCYKNKIGVGNLNEALRQVDIAVKQGVDFIGVKPGFFNMDVIHCIKERYQLPVSSYVVSKEYAMVKAAVKAGYIDEIDTI